MRWGERGRARDVIGVDWIVQEGDLSQRSGRHASKTLC